MKLTAWISASLAPNVALVFSTCGLINEHSNALPSFQKWLSSSQLKQPCKWLIRMSMQRSKPRVWKWLKQLHQKTNPSTLTFEVNDGTYKSNKKWLKNTNNALHRHQCSAHIHDPSACNDNPEFASTIWGALDDSIKGGWLAHVSKETEEKQLDMCNLAQHIKEQFLLWRT